MSSTISITGTRAHKGVMLRRYVFGIPMLLVIAALLFMFAGVAIDSGMYEPFFAVGFCVVFAWHAGTVFIRDRLENDELPLPKGTHIAGYLSVDVVRHMRGKRMVAASDLLGAAIATKRGRFILDEMGITPKEIMSTCAKEVNEKIDVPSFLDYAKGRLQEFDETRIDANIILFLLFAHVDCCKKLLDQADMSEEDMAGLLKWERFHHRFKVSESSFSAEALRRNASLGRSWVMGYTDALDSLTTEVNTTAYGYGEKSVMIHREAVDNVMRVFARGKQRNVLLMGKVGVGKRTLVENIAITLRSLERARSQPFSRVLMLQTEKLLSGVGGSPDSFLYGALARAQKSGHFILVIRDLPLLLRSANTNLKAVLMKCLEADNLSIIGITDIQDYHALIKTNPLLDSQFEKIPVDDSTDDETMLVLMAHYFAMERRVRITFKALRLIVELSKRYLGSFGGFPGKAIDVMDDAILRAMEHGHAYVNEDHVREVISLKGRVNVQKINASEKERLLTLESKLKNKIIGQDAAVRSVCGALKRARIDLSDRKRPIGTFLFLGPTGVGKTQTAKVLAEEYFGSADAMIRLDMNEYSHANSVFGIIGNPGSGEGFLAQRVQDKPFSLILLDEIEKAHQSVLNLFLQILDEGFLSDSRGMRTDFRNTIIIATSNAGALFIRDFVREHENINKDQFKAALVETILRDKLFSPEFVNRFDEIVLYRPLSQDGVAQVANLMITDIVNDVQRKRGVNVSVEEDVVAGLVERGYSIEFGAREMRRTITDMIEDYLADYLLTHDVRRGSEIVIKKGDLKW